MVQWEHFLHLRLWLDSLLFDFITRDSNWHTLGRVLQNTLKDGRVLFYPAFIDDALCLLYRLYPVLADIQRCGGNSFLWQTWQTQWKYTETVVSHDNVRIAVSNEIALQLLTQTLVLLTHTSRELEKYFAVVSWSLSWRLSSSMIWHCLCGLWEIAGCSMHGVLWKQVLHRF